MFFAIIIGFILRTKVKKKFTYNYYNTYSNNCHSQQIETYVFIETSPRDFLSCILTATERKIVKLSYKALSACEISGSHGVFIRGFKRITHCSNQYSVPVRFQKSKRILPSELLLWLTHRQSI